MTVLSDLYSEISRCTACELAKTRTNVVPGEGSADADIVFIGEAPGSQEDKLGRPFVGPAGKILDQLLESISLDRHKVHICNVIKCRPPGNRDPLPVEIDACSSWLESQLEIISPRVIVTLGRHSMVRFIPGTTIGRAHGTAQSINGRLYFAMYHPAAALHQQRLRQTIEADMLKLPVLLAQQIAEKKAELQPEQLSMF